MADKDDPLSNAVAIVATITDNGLELKANSRAVSAVDRLIGNIADAGNVIIEDFTSERRERRELRRQLRATATKAAISKIKSDPELSMRVIGRDLEKLSGRQDNVDAVVISTIDQLRLLPPTPEQSASGPEKIDDEIINRIERHAEEASTEELQQKWARVLAGEIRNPGSVSLKVIRIIDEIDNATAKIFNELSQFRIGSDVPKCLAKLPYDKATSLAEYDLIRSDDLGVSRVSQKGVVDGVDVYFAGFGGFALAVKADGAEEIIQQAHSPDLITWSNNDGPYYPIYSTTSSGGAIFSMMPDNSFRNFMLMVDKLRGIGLNIIPYQAVKGEPGSYNVIREQTIDVFVDEAGGSAVASGNGVS